MHYLCMRMDRLHHLIVWLSRITHCLGFGIQSPTDYQFVRTVINEHSPYYAYETMGRKDCWLKRKLGRLYFRVANWRQPERVLDRVGTAEYLKAGCHRLRFVEIGQPFEMGVVPLEKVSSLLTFCHDQTVLIVEGIADDKDGWQNLVHGLQGVIVFDLYYCGILVFDSKRTKQYYKINF